MVLILRNHDMLGILDSSKPHPHHFLTDEQAKRSLSQHMLLG